MRINRVIALTLIIFCASSAHPYQGSSGGNANHSANLLTMRFGFFFHHIQTMDTVADGMDKRHEDSGRWRSHDKEDIGFSDKEWDDLHKTALTCRRAIEDNDLAIKKALSLKVPGAPPSDDTHSVVKSLMDKRISITESAIEALHGKLGDQSFNTLVTYVNNRLSGMTVIQAPASPSIMRAPANLDTQGAAQ